MITAVGLAIRTYHLGSQSLWVDEVVSLTSATGSFFEVLLRAPERSNILGLYYLVLRGIRMLGEGETLLRVPSLMAGTLTIPVMWRVVRHWFGGGIGLACATFVAISPFHVWYSQEARPYALLVLLALLSIRSAQHLLEQPQSLRWQAAFVLSTAAAFYTHTVSLALFAFLGGFLLLCVPRRDWLLWLAAAAATTALCLPGALALISIPLDSSANPTYEFNVSHISYTAYAFATGFSLGPSVTELHGPRPFRVALHYSGIVIPVALTIGSFLLAGTIRLWQHNRLLFWLLVLWLSLPICFAIAGAIVTVHPFNVRYAIIAYPAFVIFLIQGAWAAGAVRKRVVAGTALALICVWSLSWHFWNPKYGKENMRDAMLFLNDHGDPGDLVIASAPYILGVIDYYNRVNSLYVVPYPGAGDRKVQRSELPADMMQLTSSRDRFWLLLSRTFHSDPEGLITSYLDQQFDRKLSFATTGVRLILYARHGSRMRNPKSPPVSVDTS